jgi:hypothetical protein
MNRRRTHHVGLAISVLALALPGCGGGQYVSTQALRDARALWVKANLRDYNLEWTSSGLQDGHYRVYVRGGRVRAIYTVLANGKEVEAHPAQAEMFGVEGLFKVIEEEYAQRNDSQPFGQPKGARVVLRFSPDPKLGYPVSYRRDVSGSPKGLSIDVDRLDVSPSAAIPPPKS